MVKQDLKYLGERFGARVHEKEFEWFKSQQLADPKHFKYEPRIYPGYWAPVILRDGSSNILVPLRYRIRPAGSAEELPSRYNVFNARIDSLYSRSTWKTLIGRRHGVLIAEKFYEWITDPMTNKKKVVAFSPTKSSEIYIPVLWDYWTDGKTHIGSFALITDDPPTEVLAAGHDRCPIDLSEDGIEAWLSLAQDPLHSLKLRRPEFFNVEDAEIA